MRFFSNPNASLIKTTGRSPAKRLRPKLQDMNTNDYNSPAFLVKLGIPALRLPRPLPPDAFIRYRLTPDGKHLRVCGYAWKLAAAHGYQELPQQQQAARKGPRHFTDPGKEAAIAGVIAAGTFDNIPTEALCPPEAFADPRWRLVYDVACALRAGKPRTPVCLESVNDHISYHGRDKEFQHALDSTRTVPWQQWTQFADPSIAYSQRGATYSLQELDRLYQKREASRIAAELAEGALELKDAMAKLEAISKASRAASNGAKLTVMTVSQILKYEANPNDVLLSNGYLEKGSPCVLCGPPGIGKSRLALQLAIKSVLGHGFLGWETSARGLKWAFLQNENGLRRLEADLRAMTKDMTTAELAALEKHLLIHALVTDTDGHLDLSDPDARRRVIEFVQDSKPDIIVGDPLTAFSIGDLNSDQDMLNTARDFGRIVRQGDPRRIPFLVHHARTGKEARAGVAGADRASYARNSKALYGWTRSQFNVAAVNKDNNDKLFFASGKCNNAPEFKTVIIELDPAAMFYDKTDEEPNQAMEELQGEDGKFKRQFDRKQIIILMSSVVPMVREDIKRQAVDRIKMSDRTFNTLWAQLKEFAEIEQTADGKWLLKLT